MTWTLEKMMIEILDNACPQHEEDGWMFTFVEAHCLGWWIKYREVDGKYEIDSAESEHV